MDENKSTEKMDPDYAEDDCSKETSIADSNGGIDIDSSEVNSYTKNPLEILEIVENLMKYLHSKDVLKCREVCNLWNEVVVKILTNTPDQPVPFSGGSNFQTKFLTIEEKTLTQFNVLLNKSKSPELLFKNVSISSSILSSYNACPIDIPAFQEIFGHFGKYVKNVEISDSDDFRTFNRCLGQGGYFPNAQVLEVKACQEKSKLNSSSDVQFGKLKLKNLILNGCQDAHFEKCKYPCVGIVAVLNGLAKSSSEINCLEIESDIPDETTTGCLEVLKTVPQFTRQLKEFRIDGNVFENWKGLCQIEFSDNLKSIQFSNLDESRVSTEEKQKGMRLFLKRVSKHLESFHVEDCDDYADEYYYEDNCLDVRYLPFMPKLTELTFLTHLEEPYEYVNFLVNFPSLKKLKLVHIENLHKFVGNYMERNPVLTPGFGSLMKYIPKMVHKHLEKIELRNCKLKVASPSTIYNLNAVFPKLQEIKVTLTLPDFGIWLEGEQIWFERLFNAISEMKNLKILEIDLSDWEYNASYGIVDFTPAFSYLKTLPSLEVLSVRGFSVRNPNYKFLTQHLLTLTEAPKLRFLELSCYLVRSFDETQLEVINKFAASNITVKIC